MFKTLRNLFIVLGLLLAYGGYCWLIREPRAEAAARAFCAAVPPEMPAEEVLAQARQTEAVQRALRWMQGPSGERHLAVMFVGTPPFSRHTCQVVERGGRVQSVSYQYLD